MSPYPQTPTTTATDRHEHSPTHDPTHPTTHPEDDDDDDYTSSSGSSSEDDDDASSSEDESPSVPTTTAHTASGEEIPRVPTLPKPRIRHMKQNPDLMARLSSFLPQMKSANEHLEREIAAGRGRDVMLEEEEGDEEGDEEGAEEEGEGEGRQYIEMNLGLGVLEEKDGEQDAEIKTGPGAGEQDLGLGPQHVLAERLKNGAAGADSNVLDMLMGNVDGADSGAGGKPSIEEV
ncbi:hypothetical protein BO71DRAFT_437431 [Aspergillus ellipticus CBS 707.79]|uniref:Uncharacterized protein n=1 Tax=Aspergillus ellipticus CBS 707.79 TaxID=1448320 RepID=A0A319DNQ9_9EURO|nr:hypothetical protein BO71DRAFT_437431 [Aspergillus ellipticus CBS 707.79]